MTACMLAVAKGGLEGKGAGRGRRRRGVVEGGSGVDWRREAGGNW